jgi:PepSY-associated transmembrane protein
MFSIIQKWHKKFGVFSALFVIFLVVSGILLNHSEQFNLNNKYVQNEWLLDLYQIAPVQEPIGFNSDNLWVAQIGERIYFNGNEIAKDVEQLKGIVSIDDVYVVAYDGQLTMLSNESEVIEHFSGAVGVPAGMQEIGTDDLNNVIIKAAHGYYQVNLDALEWSEYEYLEADWSIPSLIPEEIKNSLLKQYRGSGLAIERVLLDFHSGRILGKWGVYFVDLIAIFFFVLAVTGVWMWWPRK